MVYDGYGYGFPTMLGIFYSKYIDPCWRRDDHPPIREICPSFDNGTFDKTVEESAHYFNTCIMLLRGGT